jgi:hypothetical protein
VIVLTLSCFQIRWSARFLAMGLCLFRYLENEHAVIVKRAIGKACASNQSAPEWMVKFHSGYPLKEKDFRDVSALCKKFGIDLPAEYERFNKSE